VAPKWGWAISLRIEHSLSALERSEYFSGERKKHLPSKRAFFTIKFSLQRRSFVLGVKSPSHGERYIQA